MYLSTCIKLNNYSVRWISIMYIVLSYYWLIIGEISSYNPNTIGIIALLGVCFSFVFSSTLHSPYFKILITVTSILISFLLYKNISHSRTCFICGVLMLTFAWFIPSKIFSCKLIYWITGLLCTLGSLILTKVYIYLYNANIAINSAFSSKHFFSGRELIWIEVWKELDKHWFTGIGSQYNMTSLINGGFNVHNSILNFLAVYGLVVFILILGIMFYKFKDMYNKIYFKTKNLSYIGMCCIFILFIHAFAETTLISSMFYGPILTLFCLVNSEE